MHVGDATLSAEVLDGECVNIAEEQIQKDLVSKQATVLVATNTGCTLLNIQLGIV